MASKPIRLLVVEDEPGVREVVAAILASHGYDVAAAEDGLDALNQLQASLPDVIISDLRMPRMSGFELLAIVRQRFPQVRVIATSGEFREQEVSAEVLADAYLEKGNYTAHQLCATIAELVAAAPLRPQPGAAPAAESSEA